MWGQKLNSMIVVGPFQVRIFSDSKQRKLANRQVGQVRIKCSASRRVLPRVAFCSPLPTLQHQDGCFCFFMQWIKVARPPGYQNLWHVPAFQLELISVLTMLISPQKGLRVSKTLSFFTHISLSIELFSKEVYSYFIDIIRSAVLFFCPYHLFQGNNISFCVTLVCFPFIRP